MLYIISISLLVILAIFLLYIKAKSSNRKRKYVKSNLTDKDFGSLEFKINVLFEEEKVYLNKNLSLDDIAKMLSSSRHHISQVINTRYNVNFPSYVNEYRIEHAKDLLRESEKSISDIFIESGFSNKVTFYKVFKRIQGQTPGIYRKINYPKIL